MEDIGEAQVHLLVVPGPLGHQQLSHRGASTGSPQRKPPIQPR
jgi:hypothetical protein